MILRRLSHSLKTQNWTAIWIGDSPRLQVAGPGIALPAHGSDRNRGSHLDPQLDVPIAGQAHTQHQQSK